LPYALDVIPFDLDDACRRDVDLEPLFLHLDDPAGNPIAILEHDDGGLHREGNGSEARDEQADKEKGFEKMLAHQSVLTRRTAASVA
jgi:hypothetical protein